MDGNTRGKGHNGMGCEDKWILCEVLCEKGLYFDYLSDMNMCIEGMGLIQVYVYYMYMICNTE